MSQTNNTPGICSRCKNLVPARQGTVRMWNGSARRHAPKYAARSAFGVLSATHCNTCESELAAHKKIKEYNKRHGFD